MKTDQLMSKPSKLICMTVSQTATRNRVPLGYASGIVVSILLPVALLLFGIVTPIRSLSLIFLFSGVWTILFGAFYQREKAYWVGWGAGIAVLSTVAVLPFAYTIGLVLVVIVVLILATAFLRGKQATMHPTQTAY